MVSFLNYDLQNLKKTTFATLMLKGIQNVLIGLFVFTFLFSACSDYNKVTKSNDLEYKYSKALEYYDKKEYFKAYPLIEELVALYRGQKRSEKLFYMFAYCDYYLGDFLLASYRFSEFTKTFPTSQYTEECAFMSAYSLYQLSPAPKLDQSNTLSAMNSLQLFVDRYPQSSRVDSCNSLIRSLEQKIEIKTIKGADQYRKMENFTSSVITYENVLNDFPDTDQKERIYFSIFEAYYTLAIKSVTEKKTERIDDAFKAYTNFATRFPNSEYLNEANQYYAHLEKEKIKLENHKK